MKLMRLIGFSMFLLPLASQAAVKPADLPQWSDDPKYLSWTLKTVPYLERNYVGFAGIQYGFKNGYGVEAMVLRRLSRYLFTGGRIFVGSLVAQSLVRAPIGTEAYSASSELQDILTTPERWFSVLPELGFAVHTQLMPFLDGRTAETYWFGIGRPILSGRYGWSFSFEPGINHTFETEGKLGWSIRAKYTFGWLYPVQGLGTIPFDWWNLTAGIIYVW